MHLSTKLVSATILTGCVHFAGDQKLVQFTIGGPTIAIGDRDSLCSQDPNSDLIQKYQRPPGEQKRARKAVRSLLGATLAIDPEDADDTQRRGQLSSRGDEGWPRL